MRGGVMTGQERISHRLGGKGRDGGSVSRGRLVRAREKGQAERLTL
jgi:hypothetical protein